MWLHIPWSSPSSTTVSCRLNCEQRTNTVKVWTAPWWSSVVDRSLTGGKRGSPTKYLEAVSLCVVQLWRQLVRVTDKVPIVISDAVIPYVFWLLGSTGVGVRSEKSVCLLLFRNTSRKIQMWAFGGSGDCLNFPDLNPPELLTMAIIPGWRQAVAQVWLQIWPCCSLIPAAFIKWAWHWENQKEVSFSSCKLCTEGVNACCTASLF